MQIAILFIFVRSAELSPGQSLIKCTLVPVLVRKTVTSPSLSHSPINSLASKSLSLCIEPVLIITSVATPTLSVFFCLWPSLWEQASHTFPKQHPKEKHPINAKASAGQHNNIFSLRLGPLPKLSKQQTLSKRLHTSSQSQRLQISFLFQSKAQKGELNSPE